MASYPAPTEKLPIFSPSVFKTNDIPLTIDEGEKYFITYPTAQGAITIPTLTTGTLNVSGSIDAPTLNITGSIDTPTITSGDITMSGGLTITSTSTNLRYGYGALNAISSGINNLGFGTNTGALIDTGSNNTIIGYEAGDNIIGGSYITLVGSQAGQTLDLGSNSTGIGGGALANVLGSSNTAVGYLAGSSIDTGSNNTCIGVSSTCSAGVSGSTTIGINATATASNQVVLGTTSNTILYNKVSPLYTTYPTMSAANIGYVLTGTLTATFTAGASWFSQSVPDGLWYVVVVANATITSGSFSTLEITMAGQSPAAVVHKVFPITTTATNGYYYYSGMWANKIGTSQLLTAKNTTALTGGAFVASTAYYTLTRIA